MTRYEKNINETLYIIDLLEWLQLRGYYNHNFATDRQLVYDFMYYTHHLSWHKTQRLILKKIPKKVLDRLEY